MDYAYTLQGWLKGVNSTGLSAEGDMGNDGKPGGNHKVVARDEYGFNLNYYTGDYSAISGKNIFPGHSAFMPAGQNRELYNGNISSMAVNIAKLGAPQLYNSCRCRCSAKSITPLLCLVCGYGECARDQQHNVKG